MSDPIIQPGCILHWDKFKLADGSDGHKFFVIVGAKDGCNFLAIRATSKQKHNRKPVPGGNAVLGWYHIPGGGKDWFKVDTWLLFEEPQEISSAELLKMKLSGELTLKGNLRHDVANAICNAMRKCQDVSEYHVGLLGPALQAAKKA